MDQGYIQFTNPNRRLTAIGPLLRPGALTDMGNAPATRPTTSLSALLMPLSSMAQATARYMTQYQRTGKSRSPTNLETDCAFARRRRTIDRYRNSPRSPEKSSVVLKAAWRADPEKLVETGEDRLREDAGSPSLGQYTGTPNAESGTG